MDRNPSRSRCHRARKTSASSNDAKSMSPRTDTAAMNPNRLLYKVRNWDTLFENAQSRKCGRLSWVPVPNKHDGKSYRRIISTENGPALYGAWMLILQVASKCPQRGVLGDDDGPLDADDLSHKTGCPVELFAVALEMLSEPRIGWLEAEQVGAEWEPTQSPLSDHSTGAGQNRTEADGTEPTGQESQTVPGRGASTGPKSKVGKKPLDWLPDWPELGDFAAITIEPIARSDVRDCLKGQRAFEPLTEKFLGNAKEMRDWHRWQQSLASPVLGATEAHARLMLATAQHVLRIPRDQIRKNRVALFADIISKQRWDDVRERLAFVDP